MRSRRLILLVASLTVIANLAGGTGLPVALAAGLAVGIVGEVVGRLLLHSGRSAASPAAHQAQTLRGRPGSAGDPSPLSRRESEVAGLVALGLTNRQIAERLFLGERTVDNHVQHCFNKLGLDNRAQLAVWARDHGLIPAAQHQPQRS